ncbi:sulfite exporter TauE/SafE family protein [Stutzerimonas nosocomialis]|uniref:Probable membrane transporter protein n=1 Tax=Stutzerimonas nosocomialis TaxID=1056496 RepID=A0A5R9QB15_9GAMM|nr:sulfite exporter TauE/SafE family protein [Stutzerimonas nosocomialis]TLX61875.1 sulfite exporter TauE/SafE family protein [Stutzerimonas nosocomialis]
MEFLSAYSPAWLAGLVVALLVTGAVAGILAGLLGVGGGIVIVPVLYHLFTLLGIDPEVRMHVAVGTSLAAIIPTSIISARAHHRRGGLKPELLKPLIPSTLIGVLIGSLLSGVFSGPVLAAIFGVVALLVALNMALPRTLDLRDGLPGRFGTGVLGLFIGAVSTLMGIGGGTLSVPALSAFRTPMHIAVGTGAALGVVISIPGALAYLINGLGVPARPPASLGYVNLLGLALIVPMTMLTAPLGARIAHAINPQLLKRLFALFLAITAARMLIGAFSN